MANATLTRPAGLALGLEEQPSLPQNVALGCQHVLVSNVWLDPVFVAAVAGLPAALAGNMVNAIFLAAGLVSLVQSTRLVKLPIVEGPSAAFDGLMIGFGKGGQLAMATTGLLIGGALVLLVSVTGLLGRVRRLFSPAVTGAVILLVGIALAQFTLVEYFGGAPKAPTFAAPPSQAGEYLVYLDPIDGSSNIDTNCPIGTIFSLYQKEGGFLQQGNRQVASGYVMYGPSVLFVYTSGHGVQGFTLDLSRGCFVYSHPNIMIPVKGNIYSINEAYEPLYDASTRAYLAQVRASAAHTARYVGSLVADAHRTLLKGGHFSLSAHSEPAGRKAAPDARSQPLCLAGGPSRGQGPEQSRQEPTDHSTKDGG